MVGAPRRGTNEALRVSISAGRISAQACACALCAYRFAQRFVEAVRRGPYRRHTSPAACCCLLFTRIRSRQPAMSQDRLAEHPIDPLFTRRWSPRAFTGEAIPEATLFNLFEAARLAPSSYNSQPWRFQPCLPGHAFGLACTRHWRVRPRAGPRRAVDSGGPRDRGGDRDRPPGRQGRAVRGAPGARSAEPAPAAEPAGGRWPVRLQRVSGGAHA